MMKDRLSSQIETDYLIPKHNIKRQKCLHIGLCILTLALTVATVGYVFLCYEALSNTDSENKCDDKCNIQLVESIPEGLVFNSSVSHLKTYEAWRKLIALAEEDIEIASMYWSLLGKDIYEDESDWAGEQIFQQLSDVVKDGKVKVRIAQNQPRPDLASGDTDYLKSIGAAVKNLDFSKLMGAGVLHTKLWLIDQKHFYVGSANFDWRSLTQVKELGVMVTDCPCLAKDMHKIWQVYWDLGDQETIPDTWPERYSTQINKDSPLKLSQPNMTIYLGSSPPPFCPDGRDTDLDAILSAIKNADKFVYIAVMDYFPTTIYQPTTKFWPFIDDALREAAISRGVKVRLLASHWDHTRPSMIRYMASLASLSGDDPHVDIQVKLFTVPAFTPEQKKIPFARVNHNKYMVTDKTGFIGTSNWSGDYFMSTGGIGFVYTGHIRKELEEIFLRDWTSSYAKSLQTTVEN